MIIKFFITFVFIAVLVWGMMYGAKELARNPETGKKFLINFGIGVIITLVTIVVLTTIVILF